MPGAPRPLRPDQDKPEGEQEQFTTPTVPANYIVPPSGMQFANATWLPAGPEVRDLIAQLLAFEEFEDIAELDYEVIWRRQTHPMLGEDAIFVTTEIVPPLIIWESYRLGQERFPRFFVHVHWQHFDDLRRGHVPGTKDEADAPPEGRQAMYVHEGIFQQHAHHALSFLTVENDIVKKRAPEYAGFAATIKRFGLWTSAAVTVARQMAFWSNKSDEAQP